jgi:hypothetical protein
MGKSAEVGHRTVRYRGLAFHSYRLESPQSIVKWIIAQLPTGRKRFYKVHRHLLPIGSAIFGIAEDDTGCLPMRSVSRRFVFIARNAEATISPPCHFKRIITPGPETTKCFNKEASPCELGLA